MTHPLKVAVWGIGTHARKNLVPAMRVASGIEVVGVFSRDGGARSWAAGELSCDAYASAGDLLTGLADAVYVAVPPALHHEVGMAVLNSGKHLWCEKPLTVELEQARDLAGAAADYRVGVFEALMYQHHPQFEKVLTLIGTGRLGVVRTVEASFGIPHLDPADHRYSPDLGGGALTDAASYPISFARSILGESSRVLGARVGSDPGHQVDTNGAAMLASGVGAIGLTSWGFGMSYRNEAVVWGSEGLLSVPRAFSKPASLETVLTIRRSDGTVEEVRVAAADHFRLMVERFARDARSLAYVDHTQRALDQATLMSGVRAASEADFG